MGNNEQPDSDSPEVERTKEYLDNKKEKYLESQARKIRNEKLLQCDWTQLPNSNLSEEKKEEWETYRQKLRDLPDSDILNWHWIENFPERPK